MDEKRTQEERSDENARKRMEKMKEEETGRRK